MIVRNVSFSRYVALGDSQTEGIGDGDETRGFRGWADRLAEHLAQAADDLLYANLAVRGRLAEDVLRDQVPTALSLNPDLVTVMAGMNDLIRPGCRPAAVADCLDAAFTRLTASGARVVAVTYPDVVRLTPLARLVVPRLRYLNARLREAARFGVTVVDLYPHPFAADPRMWSEDRLHASTEGHRRLAAATAHALGLPGSDATWAAPLPPRPPRSPWEVARTELHWFTMCCLPWVHRRLQGKSSGDGRLPKRPHLAPVSLAPDHGVGTA